MMISFQFNIPNGVDEGTQNHRVFLSSRSHVSHVEEGTTPETASQTPVPVLTSIYFA